MIRGPHFVRARVPTYPLRPVDTSSDYEHQVASASLQIFWCWTDLIAAVADAVGLTRQKRTQCKTANHQERKQPDFDSSAQNIDGTLANREPNQHAERQKQSQRRPVLPIQI